MARNPKFIPIEEESFNPFKVCDNRAALMNNLDEIDNRSIRYKFKNTQDPINLAFQSFENASLKTLARDFVKESFCDIVSFITDICK